MRIYGQEICFDLGAAKNRAKIQPQLRELCERLWSDSIEINLSQTIFADSLGP